MGTNVSTAYTRALNAVRGRGFGPEAVETAWLSLAAMIWFWSYAVWEQPRDTALKIRTGLKGECSPRTWFSISRLTLTSRARLTRRALIAWLSRSLTGSPCTITLHDACNAHSGPTGTSAICPLSEAKRTSVNDCRTLARRCRELPANAARARGGPSPCGRGGAQSNARAPGSN
jgi:hypothetical protein